jgi:hypothetical protein
MKFSIGPFADKISRGSNSELMNLMKLMKLMKFEPGFRVMRFMKEGAEWQSQIVDAKISHQN